jgi:hypothetical protein
MKSKSNVNRHLCLCLAAFGFLLIGGGLFQAHGQCNGDPFCTPSWKRPKNPAGTGGTTKTEKKLPPPVVPVSAPPIEQRIAYYKQQRETAVANGLPIPKVTSVLTLEEMAITGIFKTPRGYAAMVEATPIKLSYTVYPGEKFFDGQLVAIEDNRAVFRKVTKMSNNKFLTSVENKTLRQYSVQQEVQGTAPVQNSTPQPASGQTEVVNNSQPTPAQTQTAPTQPVAPSVVVSPLDEMNRQPTVDPKDSVKDEKKPKRPAKTAKKS